MSNYLLIPKNYNTGYLPDNSYLRIIQGLDPQQIANTCAYINTSTYNNTTLKPAQQVQLKYNIPEIPNNCPCAKYLKRI